MKKWLISVVCVSLCVVLLIGTANFVVDPLMFYRKLPDNYSFVAFDYDYVNPGIAKNTEYDSLLVGTSLAENADMGVYSKAFNCDMRKLIYPGGTPNNLCKILDIAYSKHDIKKVIWSVDDELFFSNSQNLHNELPEYLYDKNPLNDVSYLFNLSIFYNYTLKTVLLSLKGENNRPIIYGDIWSGGREFGEDVVMKKQKDTPQTAEKEKTKYQKNLNDNLDNLILPLIKEHPDTEFVFLFPPKCITYWESAKKGGLLEAKFYSKEYAIGKLLSQPNVKVFFYEDRLEWTTDISLYCDNIHFKQEINNEMGILMSKGEGELNKKTYKTKMQNFKESLVKEINKYEEKE